MKAIHHLRIITILAAIILLFAGCGGEKLPDGMPRPVACTITVTQEGMPLEGAIVRLLPVDGNSWNAMGRTDASGRAIIYSMDRFRGAVPGKYKVVVTKTEQETVAELSSEERVRLQSQGLPIPEPTPANFSLVEEEYGDVSTTPHEIEVARGNPSHTIDVGKAVRIRVGGR